MRLKLSFLVLVLLLSSIFGNFAIAQDASEVTILYWQAASISESVSLQRHQR